VLLVLWLAVVSSGCATLGARLDGVSGAIAWQATDLRVVERQVAGADRQLYAFTLVLKETHGLGVTFTHLAYTISQPGINAVGETQQATILWKLYPHGELRHPLFSYFYCSEIQCQDWGPVAPWWNIVLTGTNEQDQPVRVAIDLKLLQNPARPKVGNPKVPVSAPPPTAAGVPAMGHSPVPLQIVNHLPLVSAVLNHKEYVTLLFDTGATRTMLTPETARRLRMHPPADAPKQTGVATGGQAVEFVVAHLAVIAVGEAVVENLPVGIALVLPEAPLVDGVLGGDFLQHFTVMLDYAASRLWLEPRQGAPASPPPVTVAEHRPISLQRVNNRVLLRAVLNDKEPVTLLLDTGATHTQLHPETAARAGLHPPAHPPQATAAVFGGRTITFPLVQLSALAVGDSMVKDLQVGVFLALPREPSVHGILGGDFLQHFIVTLDYPTNQLWLAPNPAIRK
jgi:predicted aspartyl protease